MGSAYKTFISLLNAPSELQEAIDKARNSDLLDEASKGFIDMYDEVGGNVQLLQQRLRQNKSAILQQIPVSKKGIFTKKWIPYAAVFIAVLASLVFFQTRNTTIQFPSTYKDPGLPNYMSISPENKLELLMFHFRKENYSEALKILEKERSFDAENDTLIYYDALLNRLTNKETKAIKAFYKIQHSASPFKDRASYFLALYLVEIDQPEKAARIFEKLCSSIDQSIASFSCEHLEEIKSNQCRK